MKKSLLNQIKSPDYKVLPDPEVNILQHFIDVFTSYKDEYFAWDNVSGTSTRGDFLIKAAVVSRLIKSKTENKYIGIMLPALQSSTLLIVAVYMAGKIPVMLNWTVGKKVLSHCVEIAKVDVIISATAFCEKIESQLPEDVLEKTVFLDKEVKNITTSMKLRGLAMSKFPRLFISTKIDEIAVILFTSGSETMPKAVPLSHKNVIASLWGGLNIIDIQVQGIFLSFLPPFHSFGFAVLSVLPLITGVKVAYTPNPTNINEIIDVIKHTEATYLIVTPTLLKMILARCDEEDLKSIELVISGAESLSEDVLNEFLEKTKKFNSAIIEGYGITECSPIISLNPVRETKLNSVGKVIKGLDLKVVDIDTNKVLETGDVGMLMVRGESVFESYLDKSYPSPFVDIDGHEYYKTGDLGYVDKDGYLFITGRLKRFVKVGGEMISMPFLEKIIKSSYTSDQELQIAVEGTDAGSEPKVVLFSNKDLDLSDVNKHLRESGVATIAKIREVRVIEQIPLLGTGKINYRLLKELL